MKHKANALRAISLSLLVIAFSSSGHSQIVIPQSKKPATQTQPQNETVTKGSNKKFEVTGSKDWTDTKIDVQPGDRLVFSATGTVQFSDSRPTGPAGLPRGWRDLLRQLPVNQAGRGALVGRIGESDSSLPFLIGEKLSMEATIAGKLYLGINQASNEAAQESFQVEIELVKASGESTLALRGEGKKVEKVQGLDAEFFEKVPRRVQDAEGTLGDMVNFVIIGSEERVVRSLGAAGWVKVDRTSKDAVLRGAIATISKQAYVELPMSELKLFDRVQDYGFAHAEPVVVVARRHHFRVWKSPFTIDGENVWVGAGTHDVGFDRDQRNGKITHKIDPQVDGEREFIRESLLQTGQVAEYSYVTPRSPLTSAKTAHGQEFFSDGRILILKLVSSGRDRSQMFAELFCSVLKQQPDAAEWGACEDYMDAPAEGQAQLGPMPTDYRVLIVPGVMNSCAESTPAYQEAQPYLKEKYGLVTELLAVPNESAEINAKEIADYLKEKSREDKRKYIVIGYSKGAPDLQTMVALYPETKEQVAALVTVAGAVGGSPIAEVMPSQAERWMSAMKFGTCRGNMAEAFKSLRRDVRQAFLKQYPRLPVPTYSLAAVSDKTNTSKMLAQTWQLMSAYDSLQDGQITKLDATLPGAVFLGSARADHFAVALPLANTDDATIKAMVDHNRYPRTALLEAIVRFVAQDLDAADSNAPKQK